MSKTTNWKGELKHMLPVLGHRNWIVITDMAYPLQSRPGIKTCYTDEPYINVLGCVYNEIEKAPHVRANIYQDKEFSFLEEKDVTGIDALRERITQLLGSNVTFVPHEILIARLDEAAKMFNIIILKTNLQIPYTTTFFELDCNYWNTSQEEVLRKKMN
jgi:hypothetical protein